MILAGTRCPNVEFRLPGYDPLLRHPYGSSLVRKFSSHGTQAHRSARRAPHEPPTVSQLRSQAHQADAGRRMGVPVFIERHSNVRDHASISGAQG